MRRRVEAPDRTGSRDRVDVIDGARALFLVRYGLTGLGTEIAEETRVLCTWTADREAQVYAARAAYDRRTTA
ncbi:hypothetical protein [Streptomyces sasae]|uniref:hypothetical protein n=1 Tax=Streptomyces sasae TaxID=1266772 RepID=UPI00292E24AB|nr:hypothetical protein [Streptomyces sasae]